MLHIRTLSWSFRLFVYYYYYFFKTRQNAHKHTAIQNRYSDIWNPSDISHPIFVSDIQTILSGSEYEIWVCCGYPKKLFNWIICLFGRSVAWIISMSFTPLLVLLVADRPNDQGWCCVFLPRDGNGLSSSQMEQKPARGRIREAYQNPPAIETLGEIPKPHPNTSGFG
jgi:hypothetical protein